MPVFTIVGGLAIFGAPELIPEPVILALTDAIIQIWRRRTADGGTAENLVKKNSQSSHDGMKR